MYARHRLRSIALLAICAVLLGTATAARPSGRPVGEGELADRLPDTTVAVIGRPGSLGGSASYTALVPTTASGQALARVPARGWTFPAGHALGQPVVATDGTVLAPATTQGLTTDKLTAPAMAVVAYEPDGNLFQTIELGRAASGLAPSVVALLPIGGVIAYTVGDAAQAGPPRSGSSWPVFGILSKVDGRWQSRQEWTAADLGLDPRGLLRMVRLPGSGDLFITRPGGEVVTVRLTGPGADGRYAAGVVARLPYPVNVLPGYLATDPTRARGDERIAATLLPAENDADTPPVLQEYGYDADADAGRLWLASAPLIAGDQHKDGDVVVGRPFFGFDAVAYDHLGNLWAGRHHIFDAGPLAVYRRDRCAPDGPVEKHQTRSGSRTVWGKVCRPDYDVLQGAKLRASTGMAVDRVTGTLVVVALTGKVLPIRVAAAGNGLAFEIGNAVDIVSTLLPKPRLSWFAESPGAFDGSGRLWLSASQQQVEPKLDLARPVFDQWLYAIDVRDLFDPTPVELPTTPGREATVQAERVMNLGTAQYDDPGDATRPTIVDSDVFVTLCEGWPVNLGCGYDGVPGNGFAVNDDVGFGHRTEPLDYRIRVPSAGTYRVGFMVCTFAINKNPAAIDLTAGGRSYRTPVHTEGDFRLIWVPQSVPLEAGVQTVRLVAPPDGEFWFLNYIVFRRA